MKKAFAIVLTIWALVCLIGCSASEETIPEQAEGFAFYSRGVEIRMNAPAGPVVEALGEPVSYTEETSCAFDGLDKTWFYGGFYLQTYPAEDGDCIRSLWFADDSVATAEGITIGSSRAEVEQAYGAEYFNGSNAISLTRGDSTLTIGLADGVVISIRYDAVVA